MMGDRDTWEDYCLLTGVKDYFLPKRVLQDGQDLRSERSIIRGEIDDELETAEVELSVADVLKLTFIYVKAIDCFFERTTTWF